MDGMSSFQILVLEIADPNRVVETTANDVELRRVCETPTRHEQDALRLSVIQSPGIQPL